MNNDSFSHDFPFAWGGPVGRCQFKTQPEDFRVDEELPFEPEGDGEHVFLFIEKTGENTDWVAGLLAQFAGVQRSAVSYAGRKDRQGVTRQWFCVSLPGKSDPNWADFETETIKIISHARHRRKLRVGALKSNQFKIVLREIQGNPPELEAKLDCISTCGVPNYYGRQRFGREGNNLDKALALFKREIKVPRNKRSMYISAARSWLFNELLGERVAGKNWNTPITGDIFGFQDNNSLIFNELDEVLAERVVKGDISPTGPLWGRGRLSSSAQARQLEEAVSSRYKLLSDGLEYAGLQQERRVLRLLPESLSWRWLSAEDLEISFRLPKGCFATTLLRELLVCEEGRSYENTPVQ